MVDWPGKNDFDEGRVDLLQDGPARRAFARRMAQALADEDLELLAKLSKREPRALFALCDKDKTTQARPIQELRVKDASFAFEAGLAWASGSGSTWTKEGCQKKLRDYIQPFLESGVEVRRHVLAFACGAMTAPCGSKAFQAWLFDAGANSHWTRQEFGGPELRIWGEAWSKQAALENATPGWCALVLSQALARQWEGAPEEARKMLDCAAGLGAPREGWLAEVHAQARKALDLESESCQKSMEKRHGVVEGVRLAQERRARRELEWQTMAAQVCAEGPESWASQAFGEKAPSAFRALLDAACLDRASQRAPMSSLGPRL